MRKCPVCESDSSVLFAKEYIDEDRLSSYSYSSRKNPEFMRLCLHRCTACDLVYAKEPPNQESLGGIYAVAEYDSGKEAWQASETYYRYLKRVLDKTVNRDLYAVDIGSGNGSFLYFLNKLGFKSILGIEPSIKAIKAGTEEHQNLTVNSVFSPSLLIDKDISLITSYMTLEHIVDPMDIVGPAYELLDTNGALVVVVHNWKALPNRILGLKSPIIDIEHNQLFSPKSIRRLFVSSGFSNIRVFPIVNRYSIDYWLKILPLPFKVKRVITVFLGYFNLGSLEIGIPVGNLMAVGYKR